MHLQESPSQIVILTLSLTQLMTVNSGIASGKFQIHNLHMMRQNQQPPSTPDINLTKHVLERIAHIRRDHPDSWLPGIAPVRELECRHRLKGKTASANFWKSKRYHFRYPTKATKYK